MLSHGVEMWGNVEMLSWTVLENSFPLPYQDLRLATILYLSSGDHLSQFHQGAPTLDQPWHKSTVVSDSGAVLGVFISCVAFFVLCTPSHPTVPAETTAVSGTAPQMRILEKPLKGKT